MKKALGSPSLYEIVDSYLADRPLTTLLALRPANVSYACTRTESLRSSHLVAVEIISSESRVISILRVEMYGLTAMLLWPLLPLATGRSLLRENGGLKRHCESEAR